MSKSDDPQQLTRGPAGADDFYRALGYALVAFTEIDDMLFTLFYVLNVASTPDVEDARKVFYQSWNFSERCKVVAKAASERITDADLRAEWGAIRGIVETLNEQRNQLAHASAAGSFANDKSLGPTLVPLLQLPGSNGARRPGRLDTQAIVALAVEFEDLADRLSVFLRRIAPEAITPARREAARTSHATALRRKRGADNAPPPPENAS